MKKWAAITTLMVSVATAQGAEKLREGKWEYTTEMEIPGLAAQPQLPPGVQLPPGMKMPEVRAGGMKTTFTRCTTEQDLVPKNDKGQENCTTTKMERSGNKVTWAATCTTPNGPATSEGTATYDGDTMDATTIVKGNSPDSGPFEMKQKTRGKYLGPCN